MCITPLPPGNKETAFGRFFIACRKRAGRLRALRVRFEGLGLPAQPAPNRPPAAAARQPCAPAARLVVLIRFRLSWLIRRTTHESVSEWQNWPSNPFVVLIRVSTELASTAPNA